MPALTKRGTAKAAACSKKTILCVFVISFPLTPSISGFVLEKLSNGGAASDQPDGSLRDFLWGFLSEKDEDRTANEVRERVDESLRNEHCVALLELLVRRQGE